MAQPGEGESDRLDERLVPSPAKLKRLTDALVRDPQAIWDWIAPNSLEEIHRWLEILDAARELELETAPSLRKYVEAGIASAFAVAGFGLAFAGPVLGPVVATTALVVGGISGVITFWQAGDLIREDFQCAARLSAIERAQESLRRAAGG
jgi:hypothetical protein